MRSLMLWFKLNFFLGISVGVLLCCLGSSVHAQEATGRVIGTVTDPQGAVVPEADVKVIETATSIIHTTKTDSNGGFQVLALPIGMYQVKVTREGFKPVATAGQPLRINQSLRIDVTLAKSDEILLRVVPGPAAKCLVVHFKIRHRAATLASPTVST